MVIFPDYEVVEYRSPENHSLSIKIQSLLYYAQVDDLAGGGGHLVPGLHLPLLLPPPPQPDLRWPHLALPRPIHAPYCSGE